MTGHDTGAPRADDRRQLVIIVCSARNRARRWLKRLREPRYLAAAIVGGAYFYFVLRTQGRVRSDVAGLGAGQPSSPVLEHFPALALAGPALVGLGVLLVAAGIWLFPGAGSLLEWTHAEVQFLFTAPVSSRRLIVHRMMRSQLGVLFGSLVFAVLVPIGLSNASRVRMMMTVWLVLFTGRVYASGVGLARASLSSTDVSRRRLARLLLVLVLGALTIAALPLGRAMLDAPIAGLNDGLDRAARVLTTGLPRVALWPFVALVRPTFVSDWQEFLPSLAGALVVASAMAAWVLVNGQAFEDLSREVADQRRDQPQRKQVEYRARNVVWMLAPRGRAEMAFAWKGLLQTVRVVEVRVLVRLAIVVFWVAVVASISSSGVSASLGVFAMMVATTCTTVGPLILRIDLRQDLQHLEVLKTWPVRAAALVRGEMLWPAVCVDHDRLGHDGPGALSVDGGVLERQPGTARVGGHGGLFVAPALIAAQLAIHNSVALMFPAWVAFGTWRARGVDAVGQRLIVVGGTLLLVTLAAAPGAIAGGAIWLAFNRFMGPIVLVPAAAVCAAVIGLEVLLVTEVVGPAYQRLDLTAIERTESRTAECGHLVTWSSGQFGESLSRCANDQITR